ncbi:hypothetical protein QLL95_gp0202 [Cotonvirus japonicus]|uniref:Uncharacterized protein n=1 Tax=Cotonvirus japonicus TaxID=2811091 RepID=A0ABM7NRA8_9VIRU|nr:hypothetical protein QLL95_gp0202 [Cotonvirus japonicus]BCS82691.1 hypothetical protein [Cotonvirus japonicus]
MDNTHLKIVSVKSSHHFNNGISVDLHINDNCIVDRFWFENGLKLDFKDTVDDFISEFYKLFTLFGIPENLIVENCDDLSELYKLVYNIKIPENIRFLDPGYADDVPIVRRLYTLENLFERMGNKISLPCDKNIKIYEFPDSVYLIVDYIIVGADHWSKDVYDPTNVKIFESSNNKHYALYKEDFELSKNNKLNSNFVSIVFLGYNR